MGVRIVKIDPATFEAVGDKVMLNPSVKHYSDNTSAHGLRFDVLRVSEGIGSEAARRKLARLVTELLNADETAQKMIND